jgi:simple sugar transport system permease protein
MLKLDRSPAPFWQQALLPVLAVVITFALTSVLVVMVNASPLEAVYYFLVDPLSSRVSALEVLVKATPILLTGAAVTWAFTGGYFNIGAEGQLYAGAVAATAVGLQMDGQSPLVALPLMVAGGFAAGMIWALTPALMKVFLNIDEVVTTLLLNSVALFVVSALLNGPWRDPISQWPQSPEIADAAIFPKLVARSRLHLGFLLSLGTLLTLWYVFRQTALGMRMKAVGLEPAAARFAGINVRRTMLTAALVSGGIAGLAGVSEVAGIHYHLIDAISPGYGYTGILVATLGLLNPLGVAVAALFIGLIDTGGQTVSRALGIPSYLGDVIQATLLLVTLALLLLRNYRIRWVR